jgi:hypothetical protein
VSPNFGWNGTAGKCRNVIRFVADPPFAKTLNVGLSDLVPTAVSRQGKFEESKTCCSTTLSAVRQLYAALQTSANRSATGG